jgi:hypothetical protein
VSVARTLIDYLVADDHTWPQEVRAYDRVDAATRHARSRYERVRGDFTAHVYVNKDGAWTKHLVEVEETIQLNVLQSEQSEDPHPVEPSHWFSMDGHEWATDRVGVIRQDAPRPTTMHGEYAKLTRWWEGRGFLTLETVVRECTRLVECATDVDPLDGFRLDKRWSPLVAAADEIRWANEPDRSEIWPDASTSTAVLYRGGDVIGIVRALRPEQR